MDRVLIGSKVSSGAGIRGARLVEEHLRLHGVDRASDLPEEAKVRLSNALQAFNQRETKREELRNKRCYGRYGSLWRMAYDLAALTRIYLP